MFWTKQVAECRPRVLVPKRRHRSAISAQEVFRLGRHHGRHFPWRRRRALPFHSEVVRRRSPLGPPVPLLPVRVWCPSHATRHSEHSVSNSLSVSLLHTGYRRSAKRCVPDVPSGSEAVRSPYPKSRCLSAPPTRANSRAKSKSHSPDRAMTIWIWAGSSIQV